MDNRKSILILGSTGSVGSNAVELIMSNLHLFHVRAIVATGNNAERVAEQAVKLGVEKIGLFNLNAEQKVRKALSTLSKTSLFQKDPNNIQILSGPEAILQICSEQYDLVISAITGIAGLLPTLKSIASSLTVAIANKESIVCGGHILIPLAQSYKTKIIPLDSEHHAISRILANESPESLILTASGGPFWFKTKEEMDQAEIADVLKHPTWAMGAKITTDCATMMNKGLEVIEAVYLFNTPIDQVKVVIHPESLAHGMINLKDGSTLTYISPPNMQIPLANALTVTARDFHYHARPIDFANIGNFRFFNPDYKRFPLLKLAYEAFNHSKHAIILMNTANEIIVQKFLDGILAFNEISKRVLQAMEDINLYIEQDISTAQGIIELHDRICRKINSTIINKPSVML